jgi:hypothetical protein
MNITTNNQWRDFAYRQDVPESVLNSEFDWTDSDDGFFQYRGCWYHISMFMKTAIEEWHGIHNDSAFSGVLIQVSDDGEQYKIATIIA